MLMWFIVTGAFLFNASADITIKPVDRDNGLLLLKQGEVLKTIEYFSLACIYNITDIRMTSSRLLYLYTSTKAAESSTASIELHKNYKDQIELALSIISRKIMSIIPKTRVKRGIMNGLGTIIKTITGNLDNEDAVEFEKQISDIRNKALSTQKQTLAVAHSAINEFSLQLKKINTNQRNIEQFLQNVSQSTNSIMNNLHFVEIYVQINFSLQLVLDRLMALEDALTFSRLEVMHPSIISPQSLVEEIKSIQKSYPFTPVSNAELSNVQIIEKSINIKAYSTEHTLTFILEIPSVEKKIYDLLHLYSIPNHNNLTIIPKSKYLILGNDEYTYIDKACPLISDDVYLCHALEMTRFENTEDCVTSLIHHQKANCTHAKMNTARGKIQKINDNTWLLIIGNEEILRSLCKTKTEYRKISGIFLLSLTEECEVNIMNRTLRAHTTRTIMINEIIPLLKDTMVPKEDVKYSLNIENIQLDNINEILNKVQYNMHPDESVDWTKMMVVPSWTTLLLYIVLASIVSWKIYKWKISRKLEIKTNDSEDTIGNSSKIRFHLKEGGVTMP